MSWSGDNDGAFIGVPNQNVYKKGIAQVDNKLKNASELVKVTKEMLEYCCVRGSDLSQIEINRNKITKLMKDLYDNVSDVDRSIPKDDADTYVQRIKIKEKMKDVKLLNEEVAILNKKINAELFNRRKFRDQEISIVNAASENDGFGIQKQKELNNAEIELAIEEQKQSEQITKDLMILENMYSELAHMIHDQGEKVDVICNNVETAKKDVDEGQVQLSQAVEHKRQFTKKKCIIILIVICAIALLALIIGLSVGLQ